MTRVEAVMSRRTSYQNGKAIHFYRVRMRGSRVYVWDSLENESKIRKKYDRIYERHIE
jgi:hypothetical protein